MSYISRIALRSSQQKLFLMQLVPAWSYTKYSEIRALFYVDYNSVFIIIYQALYHKKNT
jgi:hypothetical protein